MIKNLVIVGNGFDCWQGLGTSYAQFQQFYLVHRSEILKNLNIKPITIKEADGTERQISDVELIYGDFEYFDELDDTFWNTFESSLSDIDDESINWFFGKSKKDLRRIKQCAKNCKRILQTAFSRWIATIQIDERPTDYEFDDSTLFINFNYTDTLIKRLHIDPDNEYHIHGEASDPDSIIVGHSDHPQLPNELIKQFGGRFEGGYYLDEYLYLTDKHAQDNLQHLIQFLSLSGCVAEEFQNIYVLGHSFGKADLDYFSFLASCSHKGSPSDEDNDIELDAEQEDYIQEQNERNRLIQKEFLKELGVPSDTEYTPRAPREKDATWHISYFSDKDKEHIEAVLQQLGCTDYHLYPTIDECLSVFRKQS